MTLHHACPSCGQHLSRVRAVLDPEYGLPLVTCPGCRTTTVRRRDPLIAGWRSSRKAFFALLYLAMQVVTLAVLVGMASQSINETARLAEVNHRSNPLRVLLVTPYELSREREGPDLAIAAGILLLVGMITGLWARTALFHLAIWRTWAVVVAMTVLVSLWRALLHHIGAIVDWPFVSWIDPVAARRVPAVLTASGMYALVFFAGFPFAPTARKAWRAGQRKRWNNLRRRRRRLRDDR